MAERFDVENLRDTIDTLADEKYRRFHEGLCKTSCYEIRGVRLPQIRKLAKQLIKDGFADEMKAVKPLCYEEVIIKALVIAGEKKPFCEKIKDIEEFIPEIDNWAVCDSFSGELKPKAKELDDLMNFVKRHIYGDYEYEIRLAVVLILNYLITEKYIDCVLEMLIKVDCGYYYTSMAVAWAISFCFMKFRDKTLDVLKNGCIDAQTYKRTVRKILDSYRVSDEDKLLVRKLGQHNI